MSLVRRIFVKKEASAVVVNSSEAGGYGNVILIIRSQHQLNMQLNLTHLQLMPPLKEVDWKGYCLKE